MRESNTPTQRPFCWNCHRTQAACFCAQALPFKTNSKFALIVHPYEASSTVGTAWILRRSMPDLHWFRSKGRGLDQDPQFLQLLAAPETVPLLLFPSPTAINVDLCTEEEWREQVPAGKQPLFFVVDGTWTQANATLRKSTLLRSLPRVSFEVSTPSEYQFKKQPGAACLSCVEGVHRVIDKLAHRGWGTLPPAREHDRMLDIFRGMARFQLSHPRNPRREFSNR